MIDEHFGIVLVEFQANGCVCIAHNSAGPKYDIIQDNKGYLWEDENSLGDIFERAVCLDEKEFRNIQEKAFDGCRRFSHELFLEKFADSFMEAVR